MEHPNIRYTNPITITSQFSFCGLPVRMDSFVGCGYRCTYCFARHRGGKSYGDRVRPADGRQVQGVFQRAFSGGAGLLGQFLRRHVPIHFGGMSDPFQPLERRYRVTQSVLRSLVRFNYPVVISTRGTLVAETPYIELVREAGPIVVQFSFSTTGDELAARIEPSAPRPSERLRTMERLAREGVLVTCRWQPYIPGVSESAAEFAGRLASTGCKHIALEHLKIPVERSKLLWKEFIRGIGFDLYAEYRGRRALRDGREFVLPAKEKAGAVIQVREVVREHGMTFGAADNDLQFLSDTECCCGVDKFPGFENWFKHQIGCAVRRCTRTLITYEAISTEWCPEGSIDRYLNSRSRLAGRSSLQGSIGDHIKARWNDPTRPGGPTSFYGVLPTDQWSDQGWRVYKWATEDTWPFK